MFSTNFAALWALIVGKFVIDIGSIAGFTGHQVARLRGPFLHPQFADLLAEVKKRGIRAYSATNATVLDKVDIHAVMDGLNRLEISIDSPYQQTFERIRRHAKFEEVLTNVKTLAQLAEEFDVELSLNCVYQQANIHEIQDIIELAQQYKVYRLNLNPIQDWIVSHDEKSQVREKLYGGKSVGVDKATILAEGKKAGVNVQFSAKFKYFSDCHWFAKTFYVTLGWLYHPMLSASNPDEVNFGNLLKNPLSELWRDSRWVEFKKVWSKMRDLSFCKNCAHLQ